MGTQQMVRSLSLFQVILFGLAFMALTTVFSTYGIAAELSNGMVAGSYIVALVVMLFTAYSYGQMAKEYPISGSAYTYTQRAINPEVGFLVGWAILMDYMFIPMVNYLLFGIFFHAAFPQIPANVFVLIILVVVTAINLRGIKLAVWMNLITISASIIFVICFCVLSVQALKTGTGTGMLINLKPFFNPEKSFNYIIAGAALLCFSFLGFDSVTTFAEETKNARKNIPRAIFIITLIGGAVFSTVAYFAHNVWPDFTTFTDPDSAGFDIIALVGGSLFSSIFLAVTAFVVLGSALSSQASAARVLYAMGRDGQLPKFFAKLHKKHKTPTNNILLIGVISLSSMVLGLTLVASFINFGAFLAFIFVNISVIVHLYGKKRERTIKGTIMYLIIPFIGAILDVILLVNLDKYSLILGSTWFILGFLYLTYLTKGFQQRVPKINLQIDE